MRMRRRTIALLMTGSLLAGAGGAYTGVYFLTGTADDREAPRSDLSGKEDGEAYENEMEKMETAYQLILNSYVEDVDGEKLAEGAIQGMLASLEDPYSVYMDEETAKQFNDTLESSFEGIGAEVSMVNGKVTIVSPFKNSPAEKAGLKPNDVILTVDDESVEGLNLHEATMKIRGKKGTSVKLKIARPGLQEALIVMVKRDEIPQISVESTVKEQNGKAIGYIEISSFSKDTAEEFSRQLNELEEEGIDGLLLDVRGNPGGLLTAVEDILRELVPKDKPYIQIEQRNGKRMEYFSELEEKKPYPIAVLIDKGSASASEILAGALQEAGTYPLIGETTFGKGTVQQPMAMGDGSNIKLTLFKWLTPDGNWIHKKGIKPAVAVKQPDLFRVHPLQVEKPLKKDMNTEQVKNAQEVLYGLGFSPGRKDGYYSEETKQAVEAFQQLTKLEKTGQIDEKTAAALEERVRAELKKEKNDAQLQAAIRLLAEE